LAIGEQNETNISYLLLPLSKKRSRATGFRELSSQKS